LVEENVCSTLPAARRSPARSAAIVVESLFAQGLFWAHRSGASVDALLSAGPWLAARFLLLLAAGLPAKTSPEPKYS
jgi:hypothetical protein